MIEGVTFDWWNTIAVTTADQDRRLRELRIERLLKAGAGLPAAGGDLLGADARPDAPLQERGAPVGGPPPWRGPARRRSAGPSWRSPPASSRTTRRPWRR